MTQSQQQTAALLSGRTIVITRARQQADSFASELEKLGARVIVCPTIEIVELESYERLDEAIDHLYGYDWLIFTSVNGVEFFFRRLFLRGHAVHEIDGLNVCAIGEATSESLREKQIHVDLVPREFKAEGIFAALEDFIGSREAFVGLNFLVPRAAVARDYLPKALETAGARVDVVPAYQTVVPADVDRAWLAAMLAGSADCIAFTSSSTVRNLAQLFDTQDLSATLANVTIACIGDITAQTASEYGLNVQIQPEQFTIPALVGAIADFYSDAKQETN
jgi:uroporphyrinogen III methyltransferase/synthase